MRRHRLAAAVPLTLALTACASGGASTTTGAAPVQQTVQVNAAGTGTSTALGSVVTSSGGQSAVVTGSPDAAYAALVAAYNEIGLPLSFKDDAARRAGNIGWKGRRAVGKIALRFAVDCGEDLSGPKADTYEVTLSVESRVTAGEAAGTSLVSTTVSGAGRPVTTSGVDVNCATKGEIERALHKSVATKLAGK